MKISHEKWCFFNINGSNINGKRKNTSVEETERERQRDRGSEREKNTSQQQIPTHSSGCVACSLAHSRECSRNWHFLQIIRRGFTILTKSIVVLKILFVCFGFGFYGRCATDALLLMLMLMLMVPLMLLFFTMEISVNAHAWMKWQNEVKNTGIIATITRSEQRKCTQFVLSLSVKHFHNSANLSANATHNMVSS